MSEIVCWKLDPVSLVIQVKRKESGFPVISVPHGTSLTLEINGGQLRVMDGRSSDNPWINIGSGLTIEVEMEPNRRGEGQ